MNVVNIVTIGRALGSEVTGTIEDLAGSVPADETLLPSCVKSGDVGTTRVPLGAGAVPP